MRRALALPVALFLALAGACAHRAAPGPPLASAPIASVVPSPVVLDASAPSAGAPALPSLDALAARAPALAPGMREIARGDLSSTAPPLTSNLVPADAPDTCARVALVAQPAVHASLTNARGDLLADVSSSADTPLAPRGPVCVRKGDGIKLRVEGTGAWSARFVAWSSP